MSTSRSRLTRSIQEIAKRDPDLRRAIEATKPRGDQPSAAGVGTSDAERDRICCDGSVSDETNPGTEERDTSEGGQDASDGLNPNDTADIGGMGPGVLTGLHDCATGEPVCFEGSGWVPPDGWDSPTEGPPVESYKEGYYWSYPGTAPSYGRTTAEEFCNERGGYFRPTNVESYGYCEFGTHYRQVNRYECIGISACTDPNILTEDSWPDDSCVNLAIKGGSIVGSKRDPENDGSYSKPMSEIELCDDFGNSFYLRPSATGGWKSISNLTTGPDGHLYDSTGMQIRRISHDEFTDSTV